MEATTPGTDAALHPIPPPLPPLGSREVAVFIALAGRGGADATVVAHECCLATAQALQALDVLVRRGLARLVQGPVPNRWVAVDPTTALRHLVAPVEREITRLTDELCNSREEMLALSAAFAGSRPDLSALAVEPLPDHEAVGEVLEELVSTCREEVLSAHPGGAPTPESIEHDRPMSSRTLGRGVRMRILLQHSARKHLHVAAYAASMSAQGGEVRTALEVPTRMILVDRSVAIIPAEPGRDDVVAVLVRDPAVLSVLRSMFESSWAYAAPFVARPHEGDEESDGSIDAETRIALTRLLAAGHKDETVARRLGMSVRTCRRQIAAVMDDLGAVSRFQAGVRVVHEGWLDEPE